MKILRLKNIGKTYFNLRDLARALNISADSSRVIASRYVKAGLLIRLKPNLYVLAENWINFTLEKKFVLANLIQSPSYVSLMTAFSYYQISTQIQQDFIESLALKRTKTVAIEKTIFNYSKIKESLFWGFIKTGDFFIAEPEKALLDALYLMALKRYTFDLASIDFSRFDVEKMKRFSQRFPLKVQKMVNQYEFA